jgi:hypothetical protein
VAVDPGLEKRVCCLCRGVYREVENHDAACSWHAGRRCVRARVPALASRRDAAAAATGATGRGRAAAAGRASPASAAG